MRGCRCLCVGRVCFCECYSSFVCVVAAKRVRVCDYLGICVLDSLCVCLCVLGVVFFLCARVSFLCILLC